QDHRAARALRRKAPGFCRGFRTSRPLDAVIDRKLPDNSILIVGLSFSQALSEPNPPPVAMVKKVMPRESLFFREKSPRLSIRTRERRSRLRTGNVRSVWTRVRTIRLSLHTKTGKRTASHS